MQQANEEVSILPRVRFRRIRALATEKAIARRAARINEEAFDRATERSIVWKSTRHDENDLVTERSPAQSFVHRLPAQKRIC